VHQGVNKVFVFLWKLAFLNAHLALRQVKRKTGKFRIIFRAEKWVIIALLEPEYSACLANSTACSDKQVLSP
jgi:hypothetical protein